MLTFYRSACAFISHVSHRFLSDKCFSFASTLTFTTLLAIVPLMLVSLSVLAVFPAFSQWGSVIQNFIFANFLPASSDTIQGYLLSFVQQTTKLSIIGLTSLLISAVLVLFNMEQAFNAIWRVDRQREGLIAFLLYWSILTVSPLLMGLSLALTSYIISLPLIAIATTKLGLIKIFLHVLPFVLSTIAFTILYIAIPNCHVPARYGFISGIVAALLFEIAKYGFALYLSLFNTYQIIYGAVACVPIFLLWVYLLWLIILLGAELCHSITYNLGNLGDAKLDPFTHAYLWLGYLWLAQQQEKSLSLIELVRQTNANYEIEPEHQIRILCETRLVQTVSGGKYILGVDLHQLDFMSLTEKLPWKMPEKINEAFDHQWIHSLRGYIHLMHAFHKQQDRSLISFYMHSA